MAEIYEHISVYPGQDTKDAKRFSTEYEPSFYTTWLSKESALASTGYKTAEYRVVVMNDVSRMVKVTKNHGVHKNKIRGRRENSHLSTERAFSILN